MYIKTMADAYKGDNFENPIEIHSNPQNIFDMAIVDNDFRVW
jgi:hypothetical protein